MKRRALFLLLLVGLLALPATAWAVKTVPSSFTAPGGPTDSCSGGCDGPAAPVAFNDVDTYHRSVEFDRDWSYQLLEAPGKDDWCGAPEDALLTAGSLLYSPFFVKIRAKANASLAADERVTVGLKPVQGLPLQTGPSALSNIVSEIHTTTCQSPMAQWGYDFPRGIGDYHVNTPAIDPWPSTGGKVHANYLTATGKTAATPPTGTGRRYAYDILREMATRVGWRTACKMPSNLPANPNGIGCSVTPNFANGNGSWSEQIPAHPDDLGAYRPTGKATSIMVRVWRECAHLTEADVATPFAATSAIHYASPIKYRPSSATSSGDTKCTVNPILERVVPVLSGAQQSCPGSGRPFHGIWRRSIDRYCTGPFNTYFWVNGVSGSDYDSDDKEQNGAFSSNGDGNGDNNVLAGPLFGVCASPTGSQVGNTDRKTCKNPRSPGAVIGKANHKDVPSGQPWEEQCNNGPIADPSSTINWVDYMTQLAQMFPEPKAGGRKVGDGTVGTFDGGGVGPKLLAWAELFGNHNPYVYWLLENASSNSGGKVPNLTEAEIHDLKVYKRVPLGKWPGEDVDALPKARRLAPHFPWNSGDIACQEFTEWLQLDWSIGKRASVTLRLHPKPNRLYLVQVVVLDQRENIISQAMQLTGGDVWGMLPVPEFTKECLNSANEWLPMYGGQTKSQVCGTPPPEELQCQNADDVAHNRTPIRTIKYPKTAPKPADCTAVVPDPPVTKAPPEPVGLTTTQPMAQLLGQDWVPQLGGPGFISSVPATNNDEGLWLPRALRVSIFNPNDDCKGTKRAVMTAQIKKYCGNQPAAGYDSTSNLLTTYRQGHRITVPSDNSDALTRGRFKIVGAGIAGRPGRLLKDGASSPGMIPGERWLQAQLPLLYLQDGKNQFSNSWAVATTNPTRAPKKLSAPALETAARTSSSISAPVWSGMSAMDKQQYIEAEVKRRRAATDETRFTTLLGESRVRAETAAGSTSCVSESVVAGGPLAPTTKCDPIPANLVSTWRRLTSDACPAGEDLPDVEKVAGTLQDCAASRATPIPNSDGWEVKDAYKVPPLADGTTTELVSSFESDGLRGAPAHLVLDASPSELPDSNILAIELWTRDHYLQRNKPPQDPSAPPDPAALPTYTTDANKREMHICSPPAGYYEYDPSNQLIEKVDLKHRSSYWSENEVIDEFPITADFPNGDPSGTQKSYAWGLPTNIPGIGTTTSSTEPVASPWQWPGWAGDEWRPGSTLGSPAGLVTSFGAAGNGDRAYFDDSYFYGHGPLPADGLILNTSTGDPWYGPPTDWTSWENKWKAYLSEKDSTGALKYPTLQSIPDFNERALWSGDFGTAGYDPYKRFHYFSIKHLKGDSSLGDDVWLRWFQRVSDHADPNLNVIWEYKEYKWNISTQSWSLVYNNSSGKATTFKSPPADGDPHYEWGQSWWNTSWGDSGPWRLHIFRTKGKPRLVQPTNCADIPSVEPNAYEILDDGSRRTAAGKPVLMESIPPGEWVVVVRIVGPLNDISRWGIRSYHQETAGTKWVNKFDLQQQTNRTSVFRGRASG